jgi:hypothetical protein
VAFCSFCVVIATVMIISKSGNIHKQTVTKQKRQELTEIYLYLLSMCSQFSSEQGCWALLDDFRGDAQVLVSDLKL